MKLYTFSCSQIHGYIHTPETALSCGPCNKIFRTKKTYKHHMYYIHECQDRPHVCQYCGKAFKHEKSLSSHERYVHIEKDITYDCKVCGQKLTNEYTLKYHMERHEKVRQTFTCHICGKLLLKQCINIS